jgi:rSAM/selenodomain-associated transferase 2
MECMLAQGSGHPAVAAPRREPPVPEVAVIVPLRNERAEVPALARRLAALDAQAEVVVVDGESDDGGPEELARLVPGLTLVRAPRGRARQMNAGARRARARTLLFLHADTRLDEDAICTVERAVARGVGCGCFRVRIDSPGALLGLASRLINLRSSLLCSATGDQAIFVRRDLFDEVGGYPEVPLCEDLALVARLRGRARWAALDRTVITSARRWERRGAWRTIALMWSIRAGWHLGVPAALLARLYDEVR